MSREVLENAGKRKHKVCPFEMALDVSTWVDGVICDYNYVFDPDARLRRFFASGAGGYLFLIDEAHNLVEAKWTADVQCRVIQGGLSCGETE